MRTFCSVLVLGLLGSLLPACSGDGGADRGDGPHDPDAGATGGAPNAGAGGAQSTGAGGSPTSAGGQPSAPTGSTVSLEGNTIRATIVARDVPPGEDQHVCVVLPLPNEEQVWVNKMVGLLEGGSHHLIVDRATGRPAQLEPQVCGPTPGGDATRLIIVQQAEATVELPAGVAFSLEPRQPLFLQLHYFNSSDEVRDIVGHVELQMTDPGGPAPIEAQSIFTGRIGFMLPANSPSTIVSYAQPTPEIGTRHVFALTSHTHSLGVHSQIERVPNVDAPSTTPLHVSESWAEPPLTTFSPPLPFVGDEGLRLTCQYQNTRDRDVSFGTAATDEMCFMWVYYYDQ